MRENKLEITIKENTKQFEQIPADGISGIGPAFQGLFVHTVAVKVATLVSVRVDVCVTIHSPGYFYSLTKDLAAMYSSSCWTLFFQVRQIALKIKKDIY